MITVYDSVNVKIYTTVYDSVNVNIYTVQITN